MDQRSHLVSIKQHAIRHSYSKRGYPYDNSVVESFHAASRRRRFTNGLTKTIMKPIWLNLVTLKDFIILGGSLVPMAI